MALEAGLRAETLITVDRADTAEQVGSGDVPVLATPRLLALAEQATLKAIEGRLGDGRTSVGTRLELEHRTASPVGAEVTVGAELVEVDGRRLVFAVAATDRAGALVGSGRIERLVVDRATFLSGAAARAAG
ncbi:thioesterase family protein [Actinomadura parmotrematis]|uniref:Thioesterase n=1 Tax=Actinomadura parmotrematis TaxID=2864039 RepID=A0ABS7FYR4_9ACTN|nr:hotdog domain-containing protein [Actinomadura parmotrematis]MBW8485085.1 thioesterase [Actinomadura parmotrematis]